MRIFLTLALLLFMATPSWSLGVSKVVLTPISITVWYRGGEHTVAFAAIDAALVTPANAVKVQTYLQNLLDEKVKRSTLASGDPDKANDPAKACKFWSGGDIIYRNTLVTVFIENGLFNVSFQTVDVND